MSSGKIYLLNENTDSMIAFEESGYVAEEKLQEFLTQHPDLLPGDQISPDNPRRWLLVSREMGVPGGETEMGRWSLDHLFLDQDSIPTFVECKRSSDTRIRREVVAQMLDYAANGVEYWNVDRIRQSATETAEKGGKSLDNEVLSLIESNEADEIDSFWSKVELNLEQNKVRLIFVSDKIPGELQRMVEFLNEEMKNVEVIAIEVKQYKDSKNPHEKALVPRVVGLTESARKAKESASRSRRLTTKSEFLTKCLPESREFFTTVLDKADSNGFTVYWGEVGFSIRGKLGKNGRLLSFVYGYPPDNFQFYFHSEGLLPTEKDSPFRKELLDFGLFKESGDYTLKSSVSPDNSEELLKIYDHIIKRIKEFEAKTAEKEITQI